MKFYGLTETEGDSKAMSADYKAAREIGVVRLGEKHLYFRKSRKVYYVPYSDIRRCFRRVMLVPAKLCCGKGEFPVESFVICGDSGELAQIQMPGTRAAKGLLEEMKKRVPDAEFTPPAGQAKKEN